MIVTPDRITIIGIITTKIDLFQRRSNSDSIKTEKPPFGGFSYASLTTLASGDTENFGVTLCEA